MRVHEIARALGCQSKTLMTVAAECGVVVRSASSKVEPTCAAVLYEVASSDSRVAADFMIKQK